MHAALAIAFAGTFAATFVGTMVGCAGAPKESATQEPKGSAEMAQAPTPSPSASATSTEQAPDSPGGPVGTKLVRDVDASPRVFKIGRTDGHMLGDFSVAVDGHELWPPTGKGCPKLIRCCTDLTALKKELAMACLLAMGRDGDCGIAQRTATDVALEHGLSLPTSCASKARRAAP
jgi:hypothetical protein